VARNNANLYLRTGGRAGAGKTIREDAYDNESTNRGKTRA
jgi:hypothetical protein